jgi:ABC-type long-subunit fatty acid transport system fused permease/ATPase subunit
MKSTKEKVIDGLGPIVIFSIMYMLVGKVVIYLNIFTHMTDSLFWAAVVLAVIGTALFYIVLDRIAKFVFKKRRV